MSKPIIILQARTGSSRLPNKMIKPFYGERTVLEILIVRILDAMPDLASQIVVATTTNSNDDAIESICSNLGVKIFRGNENDVLNRFISASEQYKCDKIIRICADNVFLDTAKLRDLYNSFDISDCDYMSFKKEDGTPSIKTHYGFWAEAVSLTSLKEVSRRTDMPQYHEHVTNFIYENSNQFKCIFFQIDSQIEAHSDLRLTLDTQDDFEIQQYIYSHFISNNVEITPSNLIEYLDRNPDFYNIMRKNISKNNK